jgi:uncharacterized damage-inducible protein DinB
VHMLSTLRDLVAHKGHANASLLKLVRGNENVASDPEVLDLLRHILIANRFWICTIRGLPFVPDEEMSTARSCASLSEAFERTQEEEAAWLEGATDADCGAILAHPSIPGGQCSVAQALLQVCMHSHGHRAQIAKLLRKHGVVPPPADFVLWLTGRPEAQWSGPGRPGDR